MTGLSGHAPYSNNNNTILPIFGSASPFCVPVIGLGWKQECCNNAIAEPSKTAQPSPSTITIALQIPSSSISNCTGLLPCKTLFGSALLRKHASSSSYEPKSSRSVVNDGFTSFTAASFMFSLRRWVRDFSLSFLYPCEVCFGPNFNFTMVRISNFGNNFVKLQTPTLRRSGAFKSM